MTPKAGSRIAVLAFLFLAAAASSFAQRSADPAVVMTTVVVPVVGTVDGIAGVRWKTDVELRNDTGSEATVSLSLPTLGDQPAIITTVPPRESVSFPDVLNQAFGLPTGLSPLVIQTLGRRSITVAATVYGVRGGEITAAQPIGVDYGQTFYPQRVLPGLSFSDDYRTNIGVVNLGEKEAPFTLALQRIAGRNVAVTHFTLPPNSMWHASIQSLFPLITSGTDFQVLAETSSPETYVYASVIENSTSIARFVQPTLGVLAIDSAGIAP